jgi:hypothetical protein
MAVGDFNNDGAMDVLIAVNNGPPLTGKIRRRGKIIGRLRLVGKSQSDAIAQESPGSRAT